MRKFVSLLLVFVFTLSLVVSVRVSTNNVSQTVAKASESGTPSKLLSNEKTNLSISGTISGETSAISINENKNPDVVRTFIDNEGNQIDEIIISGKPPAIKTPAVIVPMSNPAAGVNVLSNVPAFDWSYGCFATSAAMLFGYYDNNGYPNMYTGPTNGGVCPMNNSVWGHTTYPSGTYSECPLSATHNSIDGRTTRGHVDDYWVDYENAGPDPYIANGWTEHTQGDCTGDFAGTNQSKYGNKDGWTKFYWYDNGDPLYDYIGCEPNDRDSCHGLYLFAESRGYTVTTNFSQYIMGQASDPSKGFTFDNFKNEIDSGRPVIICVTDHFMLGYGYNTTGQIIYIHDTWDYSDHQMTWGGTYSEDQLQHYAVIVIHLSNEVSPPTATTNPATNITYNSATLNSTVNPNGQSTTVWFQYGLTTSYGSETAHESIGSGSGGISYLKSISGLSSNTTYHFRIVASSSCGTTYGSDMQFTTSSQPGNLPDLTVDTLYFDPVQPTQGGSITFYFTVRNQGSVPVTVDHLIYVYVDGVLAVTGTDDTKLTSGASKEWYWQTQWPSDNVSHTFTVVVDATNVVAESDENNNSASISASVISSPDFSISASPPSQSVTQGGSTTYTVTLTSQNGFNSAVFLSATGLPTGATATFVPPSLTPTGSSTLTISTSVSTPADSYTIAITATGGGKIHTATVTLNVQPATSFTLHIPSGWSLISVPFDTSATTLSCPLIYYFDGSAWLPETATLHPGRGYLVLSTTPSSRDVILTGTPHSSPFSLPSPGSWQLIGNPFASPCTLSSTSPILLIYFFDATSSTWQPADTNNLQPGMGYLVLTSSPGTFTFTINP